MFAREERKRKDCERVSVFSFKQLHFCLFQFQRDRREGVVLRKLLTCRLEETTPFGDHFPPKSPTRHRFGDHFPPKAQHGTVLGIYISPQKPNTAPFWQFIFPPKSPHNAVLGTNFPTKFPTLDRPSFFLFWFLSYFFGLSGLMGLGFFLLTHYIMGYYMTMGLGFLNNLKY
jgi:hypothetical protein